MATKLTQERLKELLYYDPETGIFKFRHREISQGRKSRKGGWVAGWKYNTGYFAISFSGKQYLLHRLVWLYMYGYLPENEIDHIDKNKTNNKLENLREISHKCNSRNCGLSKNNKTGVTGVRWRKDTKCWQAGIMVDGKNITKSGFKTKLEAIKKRWELEKKYNFPNCQSSSSAYLYLKNKEVFV